MISSIEGTLTRFRRDLAIGTALRILLLGAAIVSVLLGRLLDPYTNGMLLLVAIGFLWLFLSYRSVRGSQMVAGSPALIEAGQYDEAERRILGALRSFSLFRNTKLLSLHHLAVLRHAQRRWQESAVLAKALLGQRLGGNMNNLSRSTRLILADAMLEMDDARGAYQAIVGLYDQRLSLAEALNLLGVQVDYLARIGAWDHLMFEIGRKVQLAELLPAPRAARVQATLSLAAKRTGRADWADWLRRRVELLVDVQQLSRERPMLWDVWRE